MKIRFAPFVLSCAACASGSTAPVVAGTEAGTGPSVNATQWPEADALFHKDPRWLGADAAYSVPLGSDRTLWLFGDTFIATSAANVRSQSRMVHNSIAVQTGADPTSAKIAFRWRDGSAGPASFFAEEGERWFWPTHGLRIGTVIVLFFARVKSTPGEGFGFASDGWRAVLIDNPDADPNDWHLRSLAPSTGPANIDVGHALIQRGDDVFSLAVAESNDHAGYLARWRATDLAAGKLDAIAWWDGVNYGAGVTPAKVLDNAGPESSLHFDGRLQKFVHVRSDGLGKTTVVVGVADKLEGPWTAPRSVFRPPEDDRDRDKTFVYAAKAHPELTGADLVVTYATNTPGDLAAVVNDGTLYYPRFVKLNWKP